MDEYCVFVPELAGVAFKDNIFFGTSEFPFKSFSRVLEKTVRFQDSLGVWHYHSLFMAVTPCLILQGLSLVKASLDKELFLKELLGKVGRAHYIKLEQDKSSVDITEEEYRYILSSGLVDSLNLSDWSFLNGR